MLLLILPQLFLDSSPKDDFFLSFINPQVVSNLYEFLLLSNSMKKYCGSQLGPETVCYQHYSNDDKIFIFG